MTSSIDRSDGSSGGGIREGLSLTAGRGGRINYQLFGAAVAKPRTDNQEHRCWSISGYLPPPIDPMRRPRWTTSKNGLPNYATSEAILAQFSAFLRAFRTNIVLFSFFSSSSLYNQSFTYLCLHRRCFAKKASVWWFCDVGSDAEEPGKTVIG